MRSPGIFAYRNLYFDLLFLQGKTTIVTSNYQGNPPPHRTRSRVRYLGLLLAVLLLTTIQGMVVEAQGSHQTHIVRTGDTLFSIAQHYSTTVGQIRALNNLTETNVLYVGQALIVPSPLIAGTSTPSIPPVSSTSCTVSHTVQRGEFLSAIATRFGVPMAQLAQANGISDFSRIRVGQLLCIPGATELPPPVPKSSAASPTVSLPRPSVTSYTVLGGDTLFAIARAHGISVRDLMDANNISDPRTLSPGQTLRIPGPGFVDAITSAPVPAATVATTGSFTVRYFNNLAFTGTPALTQTEAPGTRHDWGRGAPGPGVSPDNFTALFNGRFEFEDGLHRFTVTVDDGMRLYVDDNLVREAWHDQGPTTYEVDVYLTAGIHPVRLEYYERVAAATLWLRWQRVPHGVRALPPVAPAVPAPVPAPTAEGFRLQFFNSVDLSGSPVLTQVVPAGRSFDWGRGSPGPQVRQDGFSARMEGHFDFEEGPYRFYATMDDGVRLYIDGALVIDSWAEYPERTTFKDVEMTSGSHHILLEYFESGGLAVLWLRWQPLFPATTRLLGPVLAAPAPGSGYYTDDSKRALFHAIGQDDLVTVRELIVNHGFPHFHFHYEFNQTALHYAARHDALEIMALLLSYPEADPDVLYDHTNSGSWNRNRTPLHEASSDGHAGMVELLVSHGANLRLETDGGFTALHLAAWHNYWQAIETLLEHGANPNIRTDDSGGTPLHQATSPFHGSETIEALLRDRRIRPNIRNTRGRTPLHIAASWGNTAQVAALLNHRDTDPNEQNERGETALYVAVVKGHEEVVEKLLDHRDTDPNIEDRQGWTPLFRAIYEDDLDMVRELLRHDDTDTEINTNNGMSGLFYAETEGYDRIARLLKRHGATGALG